MKFIKKTKVVDATRWMQDGDHPSVKMLPGSHSIGWLPTALGGNAVHPGDWILVDRAGQISSMKNDTFQALYTQEQL